MQDKFKFLLNNIMISTILMISTKNISNAEKIFQDWISNTISYYQFFYR